MKLCSNGLRLGRLPLFLTGALIILFAASSALSQHVRPGVIPNPDNQPVQTSTSSFWNIFITTERLTSYNDPELKIKPVVKAKIRYGSIENTETIAYEDLWYGTEEHGLCLGARRYNALHIPSRDYVAIRVLSEEDVSDTQLNASSDAIVRLLVDMQLNDDWIEVVIVPDNLFPSIKDHLGYYNIRAMGEAESAGETPLFDFVLRSQSGRQVKTMVLRT
jgi:hypothetical protein